MSRQVEAAYKYHIVYWCVCVVAAERSVLRRKKLLSNAWTKHGAVYVKKDDSSEAVRINSSRCLRNDDQNSHHTLMKEAAVRVAIQ